MRVVPPKRPEIFNRHVLQFPLSTVWCDYPNEFNTSSYVVGIISVIHLWWYKKISQMQRRALKDYFGCGNCLFVDLKSTRRI